MNNITNSQTNTKALLRTITLVSTIALVLSITLSVAHGVPNRSNSPDAHCTPTGEKSADHIGYEFVRCCWMEKVPDGTGNNGGNLESYCSECENRGINGKVNCTEPELQMRTGATTNEPIFPTNDVVLDEQQSKPNVPLTEQSIPQGNPGTLEPLEESSNDENSESENSEYSDNPGFSNVQPQSPTNLEQQTTGDSNNNEEVSQDSEAQR